jgi:hypothetical protein
LVKGYFWRNVSNCGPNPKVVARGGKMLAVYISVSELLDPEFDLGEAVNIVAECRD